MPYDFSQLLFSATQKGGTVVVGDGKTPAPHLASNPGLMLAPTVDPAAAAAPAPPRRVLGAETASRLQSAMLDVVRRGTARGADRALDGTPWHLGGKTGTSPHPGGNPDGWFVGLVFDRTGAARYSVVVYLPRSGSGGGAAAHLAARLASQLPQTR